jgi:tetratricopeptide (TPR) repeat protein
MPLTEYVQSRIAAIREFLADPDGVVLELRCVPEQRAIAGKLLVGFADEGQWLWAAVEEPFTGAEAYCAALVMAIDTAIRDAAKEFAAAEVPFTAPAPPGPCPSDRPLEYHCIEYAEEVGLSLEPFMDGIVVVFALDKTTAGAELFVAMLGRLVEACEGGRVKLLLLTTPMCPLVRGAEMPRPRVVGLGSGDPATITRVLHLVMSKPLPRLLVYDAPRRGQIWLPRVLAESNALVVCVDNVRFWRAIHFYGRATELVVRACHHYVQRRGESDRAAAYLKMIVHPRGCEGSAELDFAQLLARLQRELLGTTTLAVVLAPQLEPDVPAGELDEFAWSLQPLARAVFTSRVKLFAVAPGLHRLLQRPRGITLRAESLSIDAGVVELGLVRKLGEHELPQLERLRCLSALASLRVHQGEPEVGIELSVEALELAQSTGDPIEIAIAWYGLGGALYQCAALDRANEAYAECVDLAVTYSNTVLAAQGITGMGHCELVIGHSDRAIERYQVAVKYYCNLGNQLAEAYVRMWIGEAHAKAGCPREALDELDRALGCCDAVHETMQDAANTSRADILQRRARIYEHVGLRTEGRREAQLARECGATAPSSIDP